jgi:hypothetical protein
MFLETQLDASLASERSEIRFIREFLSNFGPVELVAKEVHSRADLEKFLNHARAEHRIQAVQIVSHGGGKTHPSSIVLTEDEIVDLRRKEGWRLFEDLAVEIIFLSCCRLGQDRALMQRVLDISGALAVFSYTRDVDDYQAFITESLFYHLAYGFVRGGRSNLLLEEVFEKLKFSLDYLGIDRDRRPLANPLVAAVFAPRGTG